MPFILRNEFFGGLLYDVAGKDYYCLHPAAVELLKTRGERLDRARREQLGVDGAEEAALASELQALGAAGNTVLLDNTPVEGLLSAPLRIFYDITYRCLESCKHCFTESGPREITELSLPEKKGLIDQMVEMACFRISIAGGEPLVDETFFPFVEYAVGRGVDVSFSTNATLITDAVAERLSTLDIRTINVSIDGWDDASFGIVRGYGRLEHVIRGVARLRRFYRGRLAAKCTLMRTNVRHLDQIVAFAEAHGFDAVKFNGLRLAGRAGGEGWLLPTQDEYLQALALLAQLGEKGRAHIALVLPANPYQGCDDTTGDIEELGAGCYAAKESLCVTPVGDLTPCSSFGRTQFTDGNIRTASLRETWLHGGSMRLFRSMKSHAQCSGCPTFSGCRGGCHQRTFMTYGTLDEIDPYCFERKNRPWHVPDGEHDAAL